MSMRDKTGFIILSAAKLYAPQLITLTPQSSYSVNGTQLAYALCEQSWNKLQYVNEDLKAMDVQDLIAAITIVEQPKKEKSDCN